MPRKIRLSKRLVLSAKKNSKLTNRFTSAQIEHWAKLGIIAEENPELTYGFIKDILLSQKEAHSGNKEPYKLKIIK